MSLIKLLKLGRNGYPDIYRGSEKRRFGDKSLIDQLLTINFFFKKLQYIRDYIKWKVNVFSKLKNTIKIKKKRYFVWYFHVLRSGF